MPVSKIPALDKICTRKDNQIGTDVFIYGFNGGGDWRDKISVELIENFLVAIDKQKFVIKIQDDNLTRDTLKNFVRRYADKLTYANDYYHALTGGDEVKTFTQDFHGMGELNEKPKLAREYLTELKRWVREKITSLCAENIRTLHGTRTRKTRENHTGKADSDGKDIVYKPVACKKIRVIKVGDKTYRLILNVAQNKSAVNVSVTIIKRHD